MIKQEFGPLVQSVYAALEGNSFLRFGLEDSPIWEPPMAGFAAGDDPIFSSYKQAVGPLHWTPEEAWAAGTGQAVPAGQLTVFSLVFPQAEETVRAQAGQTGGPALRWAYSRNTWNGLNAAFCRALLAALGERGVEGIAPDQLPAFRAMVREGEHAPYAFWSHRHAAHAAGLGTFGLSDGLISRRGKAVRCTSLILKGRWPADPRPYDGPYGWCLYHRDGSCGLCADRCPAGALTRTGGHDKAKCEAWLDRCDAALAGRADLDHGIEVGCGLCQAAVPCARQCPVEGGQEE